MTRKIARYLLILLLLALFAFALISAVAAQGGAPMPTATATATIIPTPTPGILQTFLEEDIGCKSCWQAIHEGRFWLVLVVLAGLIIAGLWREWIKKVVEKYSGNIWPFKSRKLSESQQNALEDEYISRLSNSPQINAPDPAEYIARYLKRLEEEANPLHPREEEQFIPLEGGLDLQPRLGLSLPVSSGTGQVTFSEQRTFPDLSEAMTATDSETEQPYPAFALLGEPGAGKSTLLRKMARDAVKRRLEDASAALPLFVSLSDHKKGDPLTFLREHWANQMGFDGLENALDAGRVWLFADGLNEMGRRGYETRIAQWRDFLHRRFQPGGNRAIVACRIADYGEGLALPRLIIHAMDETLIKKFLNKRIPERAEALWDELERDRVERRGDLYQLASIPFWLVMMASVAGRTGLPRNRAALLENFVSTWLDYENSRPGGHPMTPEARAELVKALTHMAWRGLERSQNYTFTKRETFRFLAKTSEPREWLHAAQSCSLLMDTGGGCRFQHQLLQEYFAGRELAQRFLKKRNLNRLWRIPWRKWKFVRSRWDPLPDPPSTFWEEATVLAAGMLNSGEAERLTLAVLHHNPPLAARCVIESGVEMEEAVSKAVATRLRAQIENPRQRLAARLAAGKAVGRLGDERILAKQGEAALSLDKKVKFIEPDWADVPAGAFQMGSDKRKDKMAYPDEFPARLVAIGKPYKIARFPVTVAEYRCFKDADGYENDKYWPDEISRRWRDGGFQFEESWQAYFHREERKDVEADLPRWEREVKAGRRDPDELKNLRNYLQMSENALEESWKNLEAQKRDETGRANQPWLWDNPRYTISNQPVTGICWYEARAYTLWLTDVLRKTSRVHISEEIRLPTEAEWEYAARGADGRRWPWGNRWKEDMCNSKEGRVYFPSPVGIYPLNLSPFGALDMAGNVWEWCADWYAEDAYEKQAGSSVVDPLDPETGQRRVLRGGSWHNLRKDARCAYRVRGIPGSFGLNVGFRPVLSPI